jgi:8-oxo-dGTP diphosphatase
MPVLAAGGIVLRDGRKPLVAVVQRRKDDGWVLPKGKLKPNEKPIAAARREAMEETGHDVVVHEFLGVISYLGGRGPKIAHFWRMQSLGGPAGELMDDIKAVEWLPLSAAIERLSLPHERSFLSNVGRRALKRAREGARVKLPAQAKAQDKPQPLPPKAADAPPQPPVAGPRRWQPLARLRGRWQAAVGRVWRKPA